MQPGPYERVPLSQEEKDMLYKIFDSRRRFLFYAYSAIAAVAFITCLRNIGRTMRTSSSQELFTDNGIPIWVFSVAAVVLIVVGSCLFFVFTRVTPFLKDIKSGVKEKVPYAIIRKEYFPITNQYYVALDDPDYMHHEIDEDTYNSVQEGDNMYIYKAIHSRYIFEMNGRFTLL